MKKLLCFLLACPLLFAGCFSTPEVNRYNQLQMGDPSTYDVVIDKAFTEKPEEFQYAVNEFVKSRGGKSYNIEKIGRFNDYLITIPGETMVIDDLPRIRHFNVGKTVVAIVVPTAVATVLLAVVSIIDF